MAVPDWHIDLPQELLLDGYNEALPDGTIKSDMDAGPSKVRRRFTATVTPISGAIIVTASQLATFKTFFNTTLLKGALRFNWTEPPAHTTSCEMRFTDVPTYTALSDETYKLLLPLEILP